jgi:hypothetical protein
MGRFVSPGTGTDPRTTTTTTTSTAESQRATASDAAPPPKYNNFWRLAFFILLAVNIIYASLNYTGGSVAVSGGGSASSGINDVPSSAEETCDFDGSCKADTTLESALSRLETELKSKKKCQNIPLSQRKLRTNMAAGQMLQIGQYQILSARDASAFPVEKARFHFASKPMRRIILNGGRYKETVQILKDEKCLKDVHSSFLPGLFTNGHLVFDERKGERALSDIGKTLGDVYGWFPTNDPHSGDFKVGMTFQPKERYEKYKKECPSCDNTQFKSIFRVSCLTLDGHRKISEILRDILLQASQDNDIPEAQQRFLKALLPMPTTSEEGDTTARATAGTEAAAGGITVAGGTASTATTLMDDSMESVSTTTTTTTMTLFNKDHRQWFRGGPQKQLFLQLLEFVIQVWYDKVSNIPLSIFTIVHECILTVLSLWVLYFSSTGYQDIVTCRRFRFSPLKV